MNAGNVDWTTPNTTHSIERRKVWSEHPQSKFPWGDDETAGA